MGSDAGNQKNKERNKINMSMIAFNKYLLNKIYNRKLKLDL